MFFEKFELSFDAYFENSSVSFCILIAFKAVY